jgi:hypothetical protein
MSGAIHVIVLTKRKLRRYLQGSAVDVSAYYTSLAAQNYKQLLIKSGSPAKARSHIDLGDRFYFNGPHMWQTTQNESYPKYFDGKENMQHDQLRPGTGERPNRCNLNSVRALTHACTRVIQINVLKVSTLSVLHSVLDRGLRQWS